MVNFHALIGVLVLLAFLAHAVLYVMGMRGTVISWNRQLAFVAAGLLVLQYVIGFALLGGDHEIKATHYIVAILAIIPVGLEHFMVPQKTDPKEQSQLGAILAVIALILVLISYVIGVSA